MPDVQDKHTGTRIREFRLIRDYTLAQLSQRSHVSTSQPSRVENGEQPPSPSVLAAVARALGGTLSVLHGQPYVHMLQKEQLDRLLAAISSALDAWDIPPDDDMPQDSLDAVAGRVSELSRLRAKGEFAQVTEGFPRRSRRPRSPCRPTPRPARHGSARTTSRRRWLGPRPSWRTDSATWTSPGSPSPAWPPLRNSGDPRQVAVERYERAVITHAEASRPDRGVALVKQALGDLEEDGDPQASAVRGTLLLRASALSAVQQRKSAASDWLEQAAEVVAAGERADAAQDPPGTSYALAFGELNVSLGRLDVALLQDDHETAVRVASEVRLPATYQPTRVAGFLIRKAVAEAWTARHEAALDSLLQAPAKQRHS